MTTNLLSPAAHARHAAEPIVLLIFAGTLFLSAFLLFGVQPMMAKTVLPILGGSPSVWSVATVFFQATLLAGYAYAHVLTRTLPLRRAALLHLLVLALAFCALPVALPAGWTAPPQGGQALWLFGFFAVSVGLPFFAVSANGPLLQAWFARTRHANARDPYLLYGASNVGSFAALLLYPFVVEPLLPLSQQSGLWSVLFVVLGIGIAGCAAIAAARPAVPESLRPSTDAQGAIGWRERAAWIGLAFIPSGLLVSVTAHLSTDIAAAPLLWVVPLALFLLTFALGFRTVAIVPMPVLAAAQVWLAAFGLMSFEAHLPLPVSLFVHLGLFATAALICHRALYLRRPAPEHLTDFYLTIAFGGVLGGIFAALVAPALFSSIVEYPLLIVVALFGRPGFAGAVRAAPRRPTVVALVASLSVMALGWIVAERWASPDHVRAVVTALIGAGALFAWREPARSAVFLAMTAVTVVLFGSALAPRETFRSFFGVMKVREMMDGQFRILEHGTTLHGAMRIREADGTPHAGLVEPTTYYTPEGPLGAAVASIRTAHGGTLARVSVVGLGVGAMACHMRPGEALTFYEIDPLVVRIAQDTRLFRFLSQCAPGAQIVTGDARLTLASAQAGSDLLLVDAFSSDAVPAHLLTTEAMALYLSKLAPHGAVVFHISNQFLDLRELVARNAADLGLQTFVGTDDGSEPAERRLRTPSTVAAIVRDPADLGPISNDPRWVRIAPDLARSPWTDDFSSILRPLLDQYGR